MIEINNLVKKYGDKRAVSGISFTVNDDEVLGFLGPNGAGKTTTMNIIPRISMRGRPSMEPMSPSGLWMSLRRASAATFPNIP